VRASSRFDGGETGKRIGDDVGVASKRRTREFTTNIPMKQMTHQAA